jgi:glycosyltransferase involved in cell wall biosynthesis
MSKKLKILMCSEASFLNSGFGTYANEILKRLHATNKYEIAEFASYGKVNDPQDSSIQWRYYANAVDENDPRNKEYQSSTDNQFGRWRFERVLLDFQPDIVFDVRDYWMTSYQQFSPLRPYYHWVLMPTVDSAPQQEEWIDTFLHADAIFTYSDFGRDTLADQSNNKIKYIDTTSPGVDLSVFKPLNNKSEIRKSMGVREDAFLVGAVMRNQKRKLIPELFKSFRALLDRCEKENNPIGEKIYLYLHTSYPDAGWDIPEILKDYKIGNRVYFTYHCKNCNNDFSALFSHPSTYCNRCGQKSATMPNVSSGLSSENLSKVMNMFDIYVQYAICEGFGMPQVEAAACGVPLASTDYSAMSDIVRKLNGYPIRVNQYFKELETKAIRVYPDNENLIEILLNFFNMPDLLRQQKGFETRQLTEKYYNWDLIASKWEAYFDNVKLNGLQGKWNIPLQPMETISKVDNIDTNYSWVLSLISKHLPNHQFQSSLLALNMIRNLDYGFIINGMSTGRYTPEEVVSTIINIINNNNLAANAQQNIQHLGNEDFIEYAHMKAHTT